MKYLCTELSTNFIKQLMKKAILFAALAVGAMTASAQAIQQPKFFDNWSIGLDGGVTTPLHDQAFFGSMRGIVGLHLQKQITPSFAMGAEGTFGVNTSSWVGKQHSYTAFDNSYVGLYGAVDLFNAFGGYKCSVRPFSIEAVVGAGWGHEFIRYAGQTHRTYSNDLITKGGLNFNFNVSNHVTVAVKPYVAWNMNDGNRFNVHKATFNCLASVSYHFGGHKFECVRPYDQDEVDALNGQINDLRSQLEACSTSAANWENKANGLARELDACRNRKPEVVKEVANNLNSVRYVFFNIGSSTIASDQQPNVEMIAEFMKHHPNSKVIVKGYASPDGSEEVNIALAKKRAEAVKTSLVNKYKINANRIEAQGEGIGNMFDENSWNRVSICTIEESK
jgi:outer membrane protein OmpA-like peptidoglycan-associated protein